MNRDKIKKLIKVLEETTTYDQNKYAHVCGTPACIAGHTVAMEGWESELPSGFFGEFYTRPKNGETWIRVSEAAARILGLKKIQWRELFTDDPFIESGDFRTYKEDAIATLKHLLDTDEVKWQRG